MTEVNPLDAAVQANSNLPSSSRTWLSTGIKSVLYDMNLVLAVAHQEFSNFQINFFINIDHMTVDEERYTSMFHQIMIFNQTISSDGITDAITMVKIWDILSDRILCSIFKVRRNLPLGLICKACGGCSVRAFCLR